MPQLSSEGQQFVHSLAGRHGISPDAATHMLIAVSNGNGSMAQFNHPEFGGCGQWMQGGMTMVSDLFNNQLKYQVESVCNDIANELASRQQAPFTGSFQSQNQGGFAGQSQSAGAIGSDSGLFVPDPTTLWWPKELGSPAAVGSQNSVRYAYFPHLRRLAVSTGGEPWVYDTMDHQIGGFSQQQGMGGSITFTSQFGTVNLASLPLVSKGGVQQQPESIPPAAPSFVVPPQSSVCADSVSDVPTETIEPPQESNASEDAIETLERLGGLMEKGYITAEEFESKKTELLQRL